MIFAISADNQYYTANMGAIPEGRQVTQYSGYSFRYHLIFSSIVIIGLFIISRYNELLFYSLAELISVTLAWAFFMFVWNAGKICENNALFPLGIGYFAVGLFDLLHILSIRGLGVFSPEWGLNLPAQLWIAGRSMEAGALLLSSLLISRKINQMATTCGWFVLAALLLLAIFALDVFPVSYEQGTGPSSFQTRSVLVIGTLLLFTLIILWLKRKEYDHKTYILISSAILFAILAVPAYVLYLEGYRFISVTGQLSKIISRYLIYLALIHSTLIRPYATPSSPVTKAENRQQLFITPSLTGMWSARLTSPLPISLTVDEQVDWICKNAIIDECNSAFAYIMESTSVDAVVDTPLSIALGSDTGPTRMLIQYFITEDHSLKNREVKIRTRQTHKWLLISMFGMREKDKLVQITGSVIDITDQKRHQLINDARGRFIDYASNHTVHELLTVFLDETESITESKLGFFHFVEEDQETLSLQTWSTNTLEASCDTGLANRLHYPISQAGIWTDCIAAKAPVIHNDYQSTLYKNGLPAGHPPVIRELVVPVLNKGSVVAVLGVGNKATPYDEEDMRSVDEFANAAWETVMRRRTEEQLQQTLDNLEIQVADRTRELKETVTELDSIFQSSRVGILVLRNNRIIHKANQRLADIFGFTSPEDMHGISIKELHLSRENFHDFSRRYYALLDQGDVLQVEYQLRHQDGTPVWCSLSGKALDSSVPPDLEKGVLWIVDDISKRKKDEQTLHDLTEKLKAAQLLGKSGWWEYDPLNKQFVWPEETYALYGFQNHTQEMNFDKLLEIIPQEYHQYFARQLQQIQQSGVAVFEYPIMLPDGRMRWIWTIGETEYDDDGKPGRLFGTVQDITEMVNTGEKLRIQNQIINQTHDSVISIDLEGRITSWNQGSVQLFLYEPEEIIGKNISLLYPESAHNWLRKTVYPQIYQKGDFEIEIRLRRKDDSIFYGHVSLTVLKDNKEDAIGLICYTLDISMRKEVEQMLVYYEKLASSIDDMLVLLDKDLVFLQVNDAYAKAYGKTREEIIGQSLQDFLPTHLYDFSKPAYETCLAGQSSQQELWVKLPNRDLGYYQILRYPMFDEHGGVNAISVVVHDLTAFKRIQDKLTRANKALKRANEDLDQYAYVVSHDLQSPLRAIHNYATFIREDLPPQELSDDLCLYLNNLTAAVNESRTLVDDLLQFSRVGRSEKEVTEVNLGEIVTDALKMIHEDDVDFILPESWPTLLTNCSLLRQIVSNLVSNGLKFNTSDRKKLVIDWTKTPEGHIELHFTDNGIGIEEKFQNQIFKVFQRLHTRIEYPGTGIGLAIVKKAVETLGGSIKLYSVPDEGTTFSILLLQPPVFKGEPTGENV